MIKPVKRLGILCHPTRESAPPLLRAILAWAARHEMEIRLDEIMAKRVRRPQLGVPRSEMSGLVDMVVVLGGDGSILETVRSFAADGLPVAGINLGHLGFLTLGDSKRAEAILDRLRLGRYRIENRMMLKAVVFRKDREIFRGIALNDAVIVKGPILRVIDIDVSISGTYITSFRGDGVLFSTPTGSTAYALSAGGPIVPPWVNALLICPLHSHTLNARPVITSDQEILTAKVSATHSTIDLVLDGQEGFGLLGGDEVQVSRASETARIVAFGTRNFFQVLRQKMKWGR
ncbi:MAG TPA: NAD(+)/NADH kinase [Candidatus Ozemobacteraceae bacterium]|nr:NAD(+)/NADH kinase [Candidatus Ozemobacteraceae bacterium]